MELEDAKLEEVHDYIQWLFPLPERSAFNPFAPLLTSQDIEQLRQNSAALENLRAAAERMRVFYRGNQHWLTAANHNHLRISRIIRSLSLILGHDEAARFYDEIIKLVVAVGSPVSKRSLDHWRIAKAPEGQ
jgi:hypothetical protein